MEIDPGCPPNHAPPCADRRMSHRTRYPICPNSSHEIIDAGSRQRRPTHQAEGLETSQRDNCERLMQRNAPFSLHLTRNQASATFQPQVATLSYEAQSGPDRRFESANNPGCPLNHAAPCADRRMSHKTSYPVCPNSSHEIIDAGSRQRRPTHQAEGLETSQRDNCE